eukprot:Platyproteum_vivax@DN6596_c0_g2_i1.p1
MVQASIITFGRLRPPTTFDNFEYSTNSISADQERIIYELPPEKEHLASTNLDFRFNGIFAETESQEAVFNVTTKGLLGRCLNGYNGTVFCYGQTGSGKTFTMAGDESFANRGIIPRTLETLFETLRASDGSHDSSHNIFVSYVEIYNENCYDLLGQSESGSPLPIEEWPKVSCFEDEEGNLHLKELTLHQVTNLEESLDLLFLGSVNRMASSTPLNEASSRSHAVFTIHIHSHSHVNHVIKTSKLHLVDLAGSERVSKTNLHGTALSEAKYINLSLHYLEQVIVALHEKAQGVRNHIPYRNSLMTSILRDSLGGNCQTILIANLSLDTVHLEETISTSRFAQRCALLRNEVRINEAIDFQKMAESLSEENQALRDQNTVLVDLLTNLAPDHPVLHALPIIPPGPRIENDMKTAPRRGCRSTRKSRPQQRSS